MFDILIGRELASGEANRLKQMSPLTQSLPTSSFCWEQLRTLANPCRDRARARRLSLPSPVTFKATERAVLTVCGSRALFVSVVAWNANLPVTSAGRRHK